MNSFHLGFGLAAVGMFVGLIVFIMTKKSSLDLPAPMSPIRYHRVKRKRFIPSFGIAIVLIAIILAIAIPTGLLTIDSFIALVGILGSYIPTFYFVLMYRSPKTTEVERSRLVAYIPLFIASVMFWAIQEQGATILASYADTRTRLEFAGITISPASFRIVEPIIYYHFSPIICMDMVEVRRSPANDSEKVLFWNSTCWCVLPCDSITSLFWRSRFTGKPIMACA